MRCHIQTSRQPPGKPGKISCWGLSLLAPVEAGGQGKAVGPR